jgi:hypothetical protein
MPRSNKIHSTKNVIAAILMIVTLLWLTVSISFVNGAQQKQAALIKASHNQGTEDSCNPFANTTEEKAPSSINLSEEYLYHYEEPAHFADTKLNHTHHLLYNVYTAFHGELLSPPPEL